MFNFSRRINRVTYLSGILASLVSVFAVALAVDLIDTLNEERLATNPVIELATLLLLLLGVLLYLFYSLAITRQRANDIGWHPLLVTAIVFWNLLVIFMVLMPGSKQDNKFGPVPREGVSLEG